MSRSRLALAFAAVLVALLAACDQDRLHSGLSPIRHRLPSPTVHSTSRAHLHAPSIAGHDNAGMIIYAIVVALIVVAVAAGALLLRSIDRDDR